MRGEELVLLNISDIIQVKSWSSGYFFLPSLNASNFKIFQLIKLEEKRKQIKTIVLYIFQQFLRDSALLKHVFKILWGQGSNLPSWNINGEI